MSQMGMPPLMVGNEFRLVTPRRLAMASAAPAPAALNLPSVQIVPIAVTAQPEFIAVTLPAVQRRRQPLHRLLDAAHQHSLIVFAILFLAVGVAGIDVGGRYWSARVLDSIKPLASSIAVPHTIAGLNLAVPASQLQTKLATISGQPASITVGSQSVAISSDTIKSWLTITTSQDKSVDYLRIKTDAITNSLQSIADQFVKAPVNQVTATYADGTSSIIAAGTNGVALSNPGGLGQQAATVAKNVMSGNGLQFNAPLVSLPFASVTPANFNKLIEVDVVTKRLYAYQNGQLVNTFLVTAGAPATPTPLGTFHIWEKLPLQTMTGFNPNGTKYVQPDVPWINYFDHSGDAVHGNYWRPASVFGNVNTSHGCVGLQVNDALWIYDWAPIGTTVINHT